MSFFHTIPQSSEDAHRSDVLWANGESLPLLMHREHRDDLGEPCPRLQQDVLWS